VKPRVYVETSILSYLTVLPSRDLIVAAHQQLTIEWWQKREEFDLFLSEAVLAEASKGDSAAVARRLNAAAELQVLVASRAAQSLASELLRKAAVPQKAAIDAAHIALATVNGLDFLLTWNCRHIANAVMRPHIEAVCRNSGFQPPIICTPEELVQQEEP
jgi:hypothetical protein